VTAPDATSDATSDATFGETFGAVDVGTNSVRLLIVDAHGAELTREMQITRLGRGVDATGRLADDAIARTLEVLEGYAAQLRAHGTRYVRATATSATRDAVNAVAFTEPATALLGTAPEVIGGHEEAALSFAGATADLDAADGPFLVFDIGGGSTEFIVGTHGPDALTSEQMGCVRMSERYLVSDPPSPAERAAAARAVDAVLQDVGARMPVRDARRAVGLAGTVTTLAALAAGLSAHDPSVTHGMTLDAATVRALTDELATATLDERRGRLIEPARADVIVGGAIVLERILHAFGFGTLQVSECDILDGLAASVRARARGEWTP
jgi:exopolyphosphatase/guanosine-5'-triphosphate,3'-diphosphate pyrophosphatase